MGKSPKIEWGTKMIQKGCEACGGDLYLEPDWPVGGAEVFVCMLCGREHSRRKGEKVAPRLGVSTYSWDSARHRYKW